MYQTFEANVHAQVTRDTDNVVREIVPDSPVVIEAATAQLAAQEYLRRHGELLGLKPAAMNNLALTSESAPGAAGEELRFEGEKRQFDTTTVSYQQTCMGLPVWEAGVAVHMKNGPFRVVGARSTRHEGVAAAKPNAASLAGASGSIDAKSLARSLGLSAKSKDYDAKSLKVQDSKLVVYRFEAAKRTAADGDDHHDGAPTLPLPALPASIRDGEHYVATVVHFALGTATFPQLNWRAIVDAESGAVLLLQPFISGISGMVFAVDPATANGGPGPNATTAALNPLRSSRLLLGLNPPVGGTQSLTGTLTSVLDVESPTVAPPTAAAAANFDFEARTNHFAAVNAYYHTDRFFRLVQDLGFDLAGYFGPTPFPNPVDHRGFGGTGLQINAHCLGLPGGVGILRSAYALADLSDTQNPLGLACDWRVVLHELGGHGILYPHVHGPNFGFAHSAGDSFAAILNDAGSLAPDRFLTFPWIAGVIARRHDRPVAGGWAWGGAQDFGGYNSEQILSTTHFRFYRSLGGDSPNLAARADAARYTSYLILRTVGSLTPATNPTNALAYANAMIAAELGDWTTEGRPGGLYGKVVRWAFEKQGLYQPAGAPTPVVTEGQPPPVDVYIDDGRAGEYPYQPVYWNSQAIWNRTAADGGTAHQHPRVGVTNYAYVKVKNRGTQVATNVVVRAFRANPAAGLNYPNDWQAMTTDQLAAANVPANNAAEVVVGPFEWTPQNLGHECMFMIVSASGDPSNVDNLAPGESVWESRLVPHDNNIGQRNVAPVPAGSLKGLLAGIKVLRFTLKNPTADSAKMTLTATLPKLFVTRGWRLAFANAGGGAMKLRPGETREIAPTLVPGKPITNEELAKLKGAAIRIEAFAEGLPVGGMTYALDAKYKPKPTR